MKKRLHQIQNWPELAREANWCAATLAKNCGVSLRMLQRHFLKEMGKCPKAWLSEQRQQRANEQIQPPKAATARRLVHPITVVVLPRRGGGDPAKPLFYPRRGGAASKRLSFRPGKLRPRRQKRFYQPPQVRAAQNDGRCGQGGSAPARKSAFFGWRGPAGPKTTVVLAGADAYRFANASFPAGCTISTHFPSRAACGLRRHVASWESADVSAHSKTRPPHFLPNSYLLTPNS